MQHWLPVPCARVSLSAADKGKTNDYEDIDELNLPGTQRREGNPLAPAPLQTGISCPPSLLLTRSLTHGTGDF